MTIITLPWPDKRLSPNARLHWAQKGKAVRVARDMAKLLAMASGAPVLPAEGPIRLLVTFCPPDKRRRDRDNMIAAMKSATDGIADAWRVDDARFEPTYRVAEPRKGGAVLVEVLA
jgi:crossover junction endodeoxyribonuclease RusA